MSLQSDKFDKEVYEGNTSLDNWDDYMKVKKAKLEGQFLAQSKMVPIKENIFKGSSIFVNGYTVPTADELKLLMMSYGGIYHHYYTNGNTDFMVASNLPNVKIKQYKNSRMKIIKPTWITDSISAGKMLDYRNYFLLSNFVKGETRISFRNNMPEVSNKVDQTKNETNRSEKTASISSTSNPADTSSSNVEFSSCKVSTSPGKPVTAHKTASDENFLEEFYNNSRLHHISTMGAMFKQYINELRAKNIGEFKGRDRLRKWRSENVAANFVEKFAGGPCIMHIDMDCFFVSVGLRKYPFLKSSPVAVTHSRGGTKTKPDNAESRKAEFELHEKRNQELLEFADYKPWYADIDDCDSMAEVASCSYEARKFGIRNGMLVGQAMKLCPKLRTIPYDFEGYKEVSYALYNHIASYTLDIEAVSCDEMYVDCSEILSHTNVTPLEFASFIRNEIKELTGCPCSTGFGPNRLLARLATKKAKPDGQYYVEDTNRKHFIQEFEVSDLPGVGRSIIGKLNSMDVKTCIDLQKIPISRLQQEFGMKIGLTLHKQSFGEDERALSFSHKRKSVSAEVNYGIRFQTSLEAEKFLEKLSKEVESRLNAVASKGKSITLKLMVKHEDAPVEAAKFLGHGICNHVTKTVSLLEPTSDSIVIYREVLKMVQNLHVNRCDMRGIGIQVSRLEDKNKSSTSTGTIDKFVVKSKKETSRASIVSEQQRNQKEDHVGENIMDPTRIMRNFDESEYDVSFSQVDQSYLAALPSEIQQELEKELKQKKSKSLPKVPFLGDDSPYSYIQKGQHHPILNPRIRTVEIVKGMAAWVSKEKVPKDCDVKMISEYLHQLISQQKFESVNFVMDNLLRLISDCEEKEKWINAYDNVNNVVRDAVQLSLRKH